MDTLTKKNCRSVLKSLFDVVDKNVRVFEALFNNYELLITMILAGVGKLVDDGIRGEDLEKKKYYMLRCWFRYWLGLRDEYSLAFYGCLTAGYLLEGRENVLELYYEENIRTGLDKINFKLDYPCVYSSCVGFKIFIKKMEVNLNVSCCVIF